MMKIIFAIIGGFAAYEISRRFPQFFPSVVLISGVSGSFAAIAGLFTAYWGVALSRLSAFEKVDDLSGEQKIVVAKKAEKFRTKIIAAIACNSMLLAISLIFLNLSTSDLLKSFAGTWIGYWILPCLCFLCGSFVESLSCLSGIEKSRLALAEAQSIQKQKLQYLEKIRADEKTDPVNHKDTHLNGYCEDYKAC